MGMKHDRFHTDCAHRIIVSIKQEASLKLVMAA